MKGFLKNYGFLLLMLAGIVAGCVVGAAFPVVRDEAGGVVSAGATVLEPLGMVFINLMFCVVVPMVFCSICSAIANMESAGKAGRIMGITLAVFLTTAAIAAVLTYGVVRMIPLVQGKYPTMEETTVQDLNIGQLVVNFFTKPDFCELLSRKAILPLIVFAVLCGFGIQLSGGRESLAAKLLGEVTGCLMKVVGLITYYAPIGFFGFFAALVANHGPELIGDYGRTLLIFYGLCFAYMLVFFPLYARFGGGRCGVRVMLRHLLRPAAVSFGTCSSVATIPTNLRAAEDTGISRDVADIVIPLGATMHMDGSAMSAIVKVAFLFGLFGRDFTTGQAVLAIAVAVFSSVAMSGIPGGGGTGELVLCTVFFPEQMALAYPIAIALGNLVDPPATMINSAGDYVVAFIVERFTTGKDWLKRKG
jgi:Na+/H+-dicarboxylate symporter